MWKGQLTFEPPMLYTVGFLITFLFGGITGIMLSSPPIDFGVSDSYFVVAHFHYVLAGTVLFEMFAGFYFWWPKMTGKMLNSRLGKIQFWVMFIGFHMTFLVQHWMGVEGMPRRIANYPFLPGNVTTLNIISTVGSWLLALSVLMFFWNVYITWRYGERVTEEDPWGFCQLAGVGYVLPAAAAQLLPDPADQVRAARVRGALPAHQVGPGIARAGADDAGHRERARSRGSEMKVEGWLFLGCGIFFGGTDVVYWYVSKDPTGTTALALAVGLAILIGFYVLFTGRRLPRAARRRRPKARSSRAPGRSGSSARTAGGRCSSASPPPRRPWAWRSAGGCS